jgi:hypothetical protein
MKNESRLLGNFYGDQYHSGFAGNVWDKEGICPVLTCIGCGGGRTPSVIIEEDITEEDTDERE